MSENKRYYWLKLPENFFDAVDDDTISYIEEMEGGQAYVLFYLKLLCKALRTDGVLIRYIGTNCIPYDDTSLARLTNTPVDTVHCAVKVLMEVGLLRRMDSGELFLTQMKEFAGSETDKAIAMRKSRAKARLEEKGNNVTQALPNSYPTVTQSKRKSKEIDIEKEKEIKKEIKKETDVAEITKCYEENIGLMTPATAELLFDYLKDMNKDLIIQAIKIASINNKRTGRYVQGILNDWNRKGIKTLLDAENEQNNFKNKTETKKEETLEEQVARYKKEWGLTDED